MNIYAVEAIEEAGRNVAYQVMDPRQSFQSENGYCGIFRSPSKIPNNLNIPHKPCILDSGQSLPRYQGCLPRFRFWQYGEWVDVVVDDYLPCLNGTH